MEGWRQRRLGSKEDHSTNKGNYKTDLTLTGLLMEGLGLGLRGYWRPHWIYFFPEGTFCFNSSNQFCTTTICVAACACSVGLSIRNRWPSADTS
jgi:hypothetical protein